MQAKIILPVLVYKIFTHINTLCIKLCYHTIANLLFFFLSFVKYIITNIRLCQKFLYLTYRFLLVLSHQIPIQYLLEHHRIFTFESDIMPVSKKATTKSVKKSPKNTSDTGETNVSVITKTTSPKVIIKSESLSQKCHDGSCKQWFYAHRFIKLLCGLVIIIIILFTFFLSLKTYNMVSDLSDLFMSP